MSHPDYVFPPNWKPSKTVKCGKWTLPPTLLINGRKSSEVKNSKKVSSKGFTCVVCSSFINGRERANYHVFQKHYRELCELGGDAIPDEIKPDFSQPMWGQEFLKENMEMSNEDIEKAVNDIKTPSTHEKEDSIVRSRATSRGIANSSPQSDPLFKKVDENSSRKRMSKCKKCENCLKVNCKSCKACKDMIKYGGPGTWKQSCLARPKCLNVALKVDNKEKKVQTFVMESPKKVGRPKTLVNVTNKNANNIKVDEEIVVEDEIPPFQPRVFPLNDEDYNRMMKEDTIAGNNGVDGAKDENGNPQKMKKKWKDIPIPYWKTTEQELMASQKDAHDYSDIEDINKCTNDTVKMRGDDDDFEDTRDEVYLVRHDRPAAALEDGLLDQSWNDHGVEVPQDRAAAELEDGLQDESWNDHGEKVPQDRAAAELENGLLDESWNDHGEKVPQDRAAAAPEDGLQEESWNDQEVKIRHDRSAAALETEKMRQSQDYMNSEGTGDMTLK